MLAAPCHADRSRVAVVSGPARTVGALALPRGRAFFSGARKQLAVVQRWHDAWGPVRPATRVGAPPAAQLASSCGSFDTAALPTSPPIDEHAPDPSAAGRHAGTLCNRPERARSAGAVDPLDRGDHRGRAPRQGGRAAGSGREDTVAGASGRTGLESLRLFQRISGCLQTPTTGDPVSSPGSMRRRG